MSQNRQRRRRPPLQDYVQTTCSAKGNSDIVEDLEEDFPEVLRPLQDSVSDLFNSAVEQEVDFHAHIQKGHVELDVGYTPPRNGNKQRFNFEVRK